MTAALLPSGHATYDDRVLLAVAHLAFIGDLAAHDLDADDLIALEDVDDVVGRWTMPNDPGSLTDDLNAAHDEVLDIVLRANGRPT